MPEVEESVCPDDVEGDIWKEGTQIAKIIGLAETGDTVVNQKHHFRDQPASSKFGFVVKWKDGK